MSGGAPKTTTTNVTNSNIPKEFYPYFERMMVRGEEQSLQPYTPYSGQRMTEMNADTAASHGMIRDMAAEGMPGMDQAMGITNEALEGARGLMGQGPYQFSGFDFSGPGQFNAETAASYMDPYTRNVLEIQKAKAQEEYLMSQAARNARSVQAGSFGGSRQAIQEGLAERDMLNRQAEIEAVGMQSAYDRARQAFEADRAARFGIEQARAGELGRVQSSQSAENLARGQFDLSALGFTADRADQIARLTEAARQGDIQAAQLLELVGKSEEARAQAGLDMGYEDFLRQQGWNMDQLQQLSAMLHGLPIQPAGTQTTQVPYNPAQQALGMGISALGLYKGLTA
jgi:hypothetical protein